MACKTASGYDVDFHRALESLNGCKLFLNVSSDIEIFSLKSTRNQAMETESYNVHISYFLGNRTGIVG